MKMKKLVFFLCLKSFKDFWTQHIRMLGQHFKFEVDLFS